MNLRQNLLYALRQSRKNPGFTTVAVITLALGIGANTAIFSNVNALLLRPFGLPDLNRVVAIWETVPKENITQAKTAPANFRNWREQSHSFDQLAAIQGWDANLTGEGIAERAEGYRVTSDFFSLLGVAPLLGRNIGEVDFQQGAAPVVVLSHRFWQKHLGGDTSIIGKNLLLNGEKFTVVGVARQEVDFPAGSDVWAPLDLSSMDRADRQDHYLLALGRIKQGASVASANADLQTIANRLDEQFPNTNGGHSVRVVRLAEDATTGTRQFVLVLMGAAVFVLLLSCVNVANLQLARGATRQKEIAVRIGLGASRWQLISQLLMESTLLSVAGATVGVLLADWGMGLLRRDIPPFILEHVPGLKNVHTDFTVLAFTAAVALISGILSGLAPALRFSRSEVGDALKENARGAIASPSASKLRAVLVTSEVALALVLLVGAGLMLKGFRNLLTINMGFDRTHVLTLHVSLPEAKYHTADAILGYYDRARESLQSLPGVRTAAVVFSLPSSWSWTWAEYRAEGMAPAAPGETRYTIQQIVTPDFFSTLRIPLLEGRFLSAEDTRDSAPVAVISEGMARQVWPHDNPIGKHLQLGPPERSEPERRIVGVVANIRTNVFDKNLNPTTYVPLEQMPTLSSAFVIRTSGDPANVAASAAAQLRSVEADAPAYDVRTLEQAISDNASGVESSARMMFIFGVVALVLAAAGIFAVMAYSVSQRTHEIGLRMALGAQRISVLRLVVTSALKMAATGLLIGLCVSALLARALSSALFGVVQIDPSIFALLTAILAIVSAVAAFIPARWATRVDPMKALHHE
ncbi:MAG: ABC transporter permease [Candidatus Sulfotelmatobacter sp.]